MASLNISVIMINVNGKTPIKRQNLRFDFQIPTKCSLQVLYLITYTKKIKPR